LEGSSLDIADGLRGRTRTCEAAGFARRWRSSPTPIGSECPCAIAFFLGDG